MLLKLLRICVLNFFLNEHLLNQILLFLKQRRRANNWIAIIVNNHDLLSISSTEWEDWLFSTVWDNKQPVNITEALHVNSETVNRFSITLPTARPFNLMNAHLILTSEMCTIYTEECHCRVFTAYELDGRPLKNCFKGKDFLEKCFGQLRIFFWLAYNLFIN